MGSLFGSLSLRGINRIRLDPSSLEESGIENPDDKREVGKGLVKEPGSLLPEQTTGRGVREVEAEQGLEAMTTFPTSTLYQADSEEEKPARLGRPIQGS
jgi:hypothetical protein